MTCYKCGKELPGVETECDPFCGSEFGSNGQPELMMAIRMLPDKSKMKTPAELEEFQAAVQRFTKMLGEIFINSGLNDFCKRIE